MNLIAVDIGNTNIHIGLFLKDQEEYIHSLAGNDHEAVSECILSAWGKIPVLKSSKEKKRDGVIVVSSVNDEWTETIRQIADEKLGEKILIIGDNIPLPMPVWVDEPMKVGTDRVIAAAAAYAVVEDACVVVDFGSALTIDFIDENGVFQGGVICPGLAMGAKSLKDGTSKLPEITVQKPDKPYGKNTNDAINCGLYYSSVATIHEVIRRYAEEMGKWPQTVLTGASASVITDDCEFIDKYVPNLVVKGIAFAYRNYIDEKSASTN